ncbi:MAG: hypothetical protein MJA29_11065, partial [Candidatus Omnitrophica bacterium]|nr:hypothetical protein [Candidatus Omnitrophota bacterium]
HFSIEKIDLNHAFSLDTFDSSYVQQICHNARRNLKQSFLYGLRFEWINKIELKAEAYDIIRKNRVDKGYPLRMSFEDLINTGEVIQSDFFLVRTGSGNPVASSLVFHVSSDIVQVIYWGHLLEHNGSKVMNFMSFKIFEYYKELNKKVVDIGPSTQDSLPNNGLCRFKESLGCNVSLKHTFYKDLF